MISRYKGMTPEEKVIENRLRLKDNKRKWRAKNQSKSYLIDLKSILKLQYGMTIEEYETLFKAQDGVCAVCKDVCNTHTRLSVDHCHETGEVRGLLCFRCNVSLGNVNDDVNKLKNMIKYLENK